MIDLGQARTVQERRAGASTLPFAGPAERRARNLALATDNARDWAYWRQLRNERIAHHDHRR